MLSAHTEGMAETYWEHDGPKVVDSKSVDEFSSAAGGVQRLLPTGGCDECEYSSICEARLALLVRMEST